MAWRIVFFVLVFGNLLVFAWAQGYLGGHEEGREPQRLGQQLHPEKLRVVRGDAGPAPAPAAKPKEEPLACRAISGLATAEAGVLGKAVEAAGWKAAVLPEAGATRYLVLIADLANKAAADKKAGELRQLGVKEFSVTALDGGRQEIVFAAVETEAGAKEALAGLVKKGIKSAKVDAREQPATKARVDIRAPAEALAKRLPELIGPYASATVGDCPAP